MKYYETTFDEYIQSVEKHNIHPELFQTFSKFPENIHDFENTIVYGPPGAGKYSQTLSFLNKYSPSNLKYEKKITAATDKQQYIYRISDIHYEVDMSLLGCNSKTLWHELFFQIIDIVSVKPDKIGIIICKNFHQIHSELLEIFYSYMQHYNHSHTNIYIKFIILTEHVSFLPYTITNSCHLIKIQRPSIENCKYIIHKDSTVGEHNIDRFLNRITYNKTASLTSSVGPSLLDVVESKDILNLKDIKFFDLLNNKTTSQNIPEDIFNIVCDKIIDDMSRIKKDNFIEFRESLYNILTYNLDVTDCIWYILSHFISIGSLNTIETSQIIDRTYTFLKYYNNNYRPIYHLESMLFYIINKIYKLDE